MNRAPADYHAWYGTPRGAWMADQERRLILDLLALPPGERVLDVGCGTGYFSSALADAGLGVTGLDPDMAALDFLARRDGRSLLIKGQAATLPFANGAFAGVVAITSLCFCTNPMLALSEMWRVSQRVVVLGLLHRHSLLYLTKAGRGGYAGARWDTLDEVRAWAHELTPAPDILARCALLLPTAGPLARGIEQQFGKLLPIGGFLAVALRRPSGA